MIRNVKLEPIVFILWEILGPYYKFNEPNKDYVLNSTAVRDSREDIVNYVSTASDQGPVIACFELKKAEQALSFNYLI
jgi:hypothetical protein